MDAILTADQTRAAEAAVFDGGTTPWDLMQRAAGLAAEWVHRLAAGRPIVVLCGPGNNGGDGYVIVHELTARGHAVDVVAPADPTSELASRARALWDGNASHTVSLAGACVVDCFFGHGLSRPVDPRFASWLERADSEASFTIALDMPSNVECDSGAILGPIAGPDVTLAVGCLKPCHVLMPSAASMGELRVLDIGLDPKARWGRLSRRPQLETPSANAHKYTRGYGAVLAGAMPGAAELAALGLQGGGAGYVALIAEDRPTSLPPDIVWHGKLAAFDDERLSALVVGPGLGRDANAVALLEAALNGAARLVLDADALHLLNPTHRDALSRRTVLLTPHEGELQALCEAFDISGGTKKERCQKLADATQSLVLAKGPDTLLCFGDECIAFPRSSSWLSVAGSGDVLAGLCAARLAVEEDCALAVEQAVWIHAFAARAAGPAFTASDLAAAARFAFEHFR